MNTVSTSKVGVEGSLGILQCNRRVPTICYVNSPWLCPFDRKTGPRIIDKVQWRH